MQVDLRDTLREFAQNGKQPRFIHIAAAGHSKHPIVAGQATAPQPPPHQSEPGPQQGAGEALPRPLRAGKPQWLIRHAHSRHAEVAPDAQYVAQYEWMQVEMFVSVDMIEPQPRTGEGRELRADFGTQ